MSEVLSQAEIDALLEGISKGEIEEDAAEAGKKYQVYDFRRPTKFSKENVRALQLLHESFARQLANTLAGYLRINTRCLLSSMEQVTCEEFLRSLPSPTVICECNLGSEERPVLMEMSLSLAFGIIDRILGGLGTGDVAERELTEIEKTLLEDVVMRILATLSYAWSTVVAVDFRFDKIEARPQFVQVVFPTEIVLAVSFEMEVGASEGFINLCFPYSSMQEILDALNTERWLSSRTTEKRKELALREELSTVKVPLVAVLGKVRLSLADVKSLEVDQVIRLDTGIEGHVIVKVGKRPAFYGRPGTVGRQLAVRIISRIEEE